MSQLEVNGAGNHPSTSDTAACGCATVHADVVSRVKLRMPDETRLYDVAELFKVFGDTTRIRVLCALAEAEMCVCDISALLDMSQSAISHQLRVLKQARLVRYRREGKSSYYSLDDDHVRTIFAEGLSHVTE